MGAVDYGGFYGKFDYGGCEYGEFEYGGCDYGEYDYGECEYGGCVMVRVRVWVRYGLGLGIQTR